MKKILSFLVFAMIIFTSCEKYEDYDFMEYDYSVVYFPYDVLKRTTVSDEGMSIKVGVFIGGLRDNPEKQEFTYELCNVASGYTQLPKDYYTLGNTSVIVADEGSLQGFVDVNFIQEEFIKNPLCLEHNYALGFKITGQANLDSIWEDHDSTTIPIKYINTFQGNYYPIGDIRVFEPGNDMLQNIIGYGDIYDYTKFQTKYLSTLSVNSVLVGGIANRTDKNCLMSLSINDDNSVLIKAVSGSLYEVIPEGESTWDPVTRRFNLKYMYVNGGLEYHVEELLVFRNRIRDGISEWRWPGFEGN